MNMIKRAVVMGSAFVFLAIALAIIWMGFDVVFALLNMGSTPAVILGSILVVPLIGFCAFFLYEAWKAACARLRSKKGAPNDPRDL